MHTQLHKQLPNVNTPCIQQRSKCNVLGNLSHAVCPVRLLNNLLRLSLYGHNEFKASICQKPVRQLLATDERCEAPIFLAVKASLSFCKP